MKTAWIIFLYICLFAATIDYIKNQKEIKILKQELSIDENYLLNNKRYWANGQDFVDWKQWRRESAEREVNRK